MDETEGDSPNYGANQGFVSANRPKIADNYVNEDEDEVEEDEEEQEQELHDPDVKINGDIRKNGVDNDQDDDIDDTNEDDDGEDNSRSNNLDLQRHPKKRKLKSLLSSFELAPRVPVPSPSATANSTPKQRNTLTDWTEHASFVLLDAWGERFLKRGRKSLRSEEWQEVAEQVSHESKIERTDAQCRNRLDTLKKKYKKEKSSLENKRIVNTKWVYFKKMDTLMASAPPKAQQAGLSCGVDSGEYVFTNPPVYLNRANGLDEMRDSPGNTDSQEGDDDDSYLLPLKRSRNNVGSFRLLADSINKFSEIYEKIEDRKRKQMVELEKMRMDFQRELELQKREILDRARDEIAKIRGDYEENDSG